MCDVGQNFMFMFLNEYQNKNIKDFNNFFIFKNDSLNIQNAFFEDLKTERSEIGEKLLQKL